MTGHDRALMFLYDFTMSTREINLMENLSRRAFKGKCQVKILNHGKT